MGVTSFDVLRQPGANAKMQIARRANAGILIAL
jgi:hypothetical protein